MEREMARIGHARLLVVPSIAQTAGHGTTAPNSSDQPCVFTHAA
jgi:hypothetical protein